MIDRIQSQSFLSISFRCNDVIHQDKDEIEYLKVKAFYKYFTKFFRSNIRFRSDQYWMKCFCYNLNLYFENFSENNRLITTLCPEGGVDNEIFNSWKRISWFLLQI